MSVRPISARANLESTEYSDIKFLATWNDEAVKAAWSQDTPEDKLPYIIYAASKTEGERSLWKWAKENNPPPFVVNAVLPDANVRNTRHRGLWITD